ncbi:transposase, partial [Streptococcus sp. 10F2]
RNSDERQALIEMMERSPFDKALVIADRGYESYNLMAHFQEHKWEYLIRIKDGATSMKRSLELPVTDTYDIPIKLSLTRRQTKETFLQFKARNHFKFIPSNQRFDYLSTSWDRNSPPEYYNLAFRIVRLEIEEGHYETLVTNTDYTVKKLKSLYADRWGIETSFRDLKYSLGLINFHSKKMEGIYQEIFAHLSMYNFSKAISSQI